MRSACRAFPLWCRGWELRQWLSDAHGRRSDSTNRLLALQGATSKAVRHDPARGRVTALDPREEEQDLAGRGSARADGWRDRELSAYRSCRAGRDLAMAGYWGAEILAGICPDDMTGALAEWRATVVGEVPLEVATLQAARVIFSDSTRPPPMGGSRPSSR